MDLLARSLLQNRVVSGLCYRTVDIVAVLVTKPLPAPGSATEPAIEQPEHVQLGEMRTGLVAVRQWQQYQQQYYQFDAFHKHLVMLTTLAQGSRAILGAPSE